jgi:hypothetical protein
MELTIEESEHRYHELKEYFRYLVGTHAIVVISDTPMSEWTIVRGISEEQFDKLKCEYIQNNTNYVEFRSYFRGSGYFYVDENIQKCEELRTGEVLYFSDKRISKKQRELIRSEFKALLRAG